MSLDGVERPYRLQYSLQTDSSVKYLAAGNVVVYILLSFKLLFQINCKKNNR